MQEAAGAPLAAWESFYVIVGSSAAALTGLQFVVIALLAETRRRSSTHEIEAFATPTIVHFGAVLLISAILSAPWHALASAGLALGASGVAGIAYVAAVIRRARRQTGYKLVLEDWVSHAALPLAGYAALFGAAVALGRAPQTSLFVVGGTALLLLFVGIHNAWDTVTYIVIDRPPAEKPSENR